MKNRMREIRTSGSVRGGAGNGPTYSAVGELKAPSTLSQRFICIVVVANDGSCVVAEQVMRGLC
jgi:hypothetical protein